MTDETRDALLLAIAGWIKAQTWGSDPWEGTDRLSDIMHFYTRARHEIERPEDRG